MKSQRALFQWLAMAVITAMLLQFAVVLPSVSAQGEEPPTPTEAPTEEPTEEPAEPLPEPTPYATDVPPEEGEGMQLFSALVATPTPADPDCSDGQCVFWVSAGTNPGNNDAGQHFNCTYSTTTNEIYMGQCTNGQPITSGFRFPNINIPKGTFIQEAHIEFTVDGPYSDDLHVAFYGQDSVNASAFSSTSGPNNRLLINTVPPVPWHIESSDVWALGEIRNSPPLTSIVQEIVNRETWVSGNAMAIILKNVGPSSGVNKHRRVIAYNRPPLSYGSANAARLVITLGTHVPLIFLPGVTGTYLNNHEGEVWLGDVLTSSSDESLLALRLDAAGTGPLFPDEEDYATVEAGDVIPNILSLDFYGHAIETLEEAGYQQGVDLFLFPYDWRQDIDVLSNDLLTRIDEIRAQTGADQVDIVAHSMGGLVTRATLANPNSIGKVRKVFTLGSPVLGAPKILGILQYQTPCFIEIEKTPVCFTKPAIVQELLTNLIPVYQILPSPAYHLAQMAPLNIDHDTNGDGLPEGAQDYSEWTAIVSANRNSALLQKNEPFHQAYDNLSLADPSVQFYRVVGDQTNTIVQIREYIKCFIGNFNCDVKYELIMDNGDGTVPLHSADLYNPATGFDYRAGITNYYAHGVKHAGLPGNECMLNMILAFVEDSVAGCANTATSIFKMASPVDMSTTISNTPEPFSGIELETLGPVQGIVEDEEGSVLGPSTDLDANVIPGGIYNAISDTQSFFLNQNGNYVAQLTINGVEPVTLRIRTYAEDAMNGQAVFNIELPVDTNLEISFGSGQNLNSLRLGIDYDGNGSVDEEVAPNSVATGSSANDRESPSTTATIQSIDQQQATIILTAVDQPTGSGVAVTYYEIAGANSSIYTEPVSVPLDTVLRFFSVDQAGNTEAIQEFQVALADFYLHGTGATANPATLFLDTTLPTSTTTKYKDTASLKFSGGNLWKDVGTWAASPSLSVGDLNNLNQLEVWLGLKNSDDQGTNFDLRVEVYKNNTLLSSAESLCVTGVTRNPNLARQVILSFADLLPTTFNGTTDVLSLKLKARIGTNGSGGMCGGHSNAVGLRLYFDALSRPSGFDGVFKP